jgi:hypothetical protein
VICGLRPDGFVPRPTGTNDRLVRSGVSPSADAPRQFPAGAEDGLKELRQARLTVPRLNRGGTRLAGCGRPWPSCPLYGSAMSKWEYATVPLLVHATKQILDSWGDDGWELVAVVPGPNPEQLVAYLKRVKE